MTFKIKDARPFQKHVGSNERALHWWVISTNTKAEVLELKNIKSFDQAVIRWEKLKSKNVVRCYKCQRFNHIAKGCFYAPNCGRCGEEHLTSDCEEKHVEKGHPRYRKYRCINCRVEGHPAFDKECPAIRAEEIRR